MGVHFQPSFPDKSNDFPDHFWFQRSVILFSCSTHAASSSPRKEPSIIAHTVRPCSEWGLQDRVLWHILKRVLEGTAVWAVFSTLTGSLFGQPLRKEKERERRGVMESPSRNGAVPPHCFLLGSLHEAELWWLKDTCRCEPHNMKHHWNGSTVRQLCLSPERALSFLLKSRSSEKAGLRFWGIHLVSRRVQHNSQQHMLSIFFKIEAGSAPWTWKFCFQ